MKKIFALSVLMFSLSSGFMSTSIWAQEGNENRAVNPGEDPNEEKSKKPFESDVAAPGVCSECFGRLVHGRLGAKTNPPLKGSAGTSGDSSGAESGAEGTR